MIRFTKFESYGLAFAAITEVSDGDFSQRDSFPILPEVNSRSGVTVSAPITVTQVHGTDIAIADERGAVSRLEADGIATECPSIPIAIRIADCVPVFLYEPGLRACAIVHAGREGTSHGIARKAVRVLEDIFQADPRQMVAHIGPSAGPCCYEVSEEMAKAFSENGLPTRGRYLDLWEANARQLAAAGLSPNAITIEGRCTICDKSFHSYRRDGTARRNLAVVIM